MIDYTILMVQRHWPDITERAVKSIREFTDAEIILVDDNSPDESSRIGFFNIGKCYRDVLTLSVEKQSQHGICLDAALAYTTTDWIITADNDVIIHDERAFSILLDKAGSDVGAVGRTQINNMTKRFGTYIHPYWALWNGRTILEHNLSFASFTLAGEETWTFATAQFLSYRLASLGERPWEAPDIPHRLVPVNLNGFVEHAQVWQERGDTWRGEVKLG